jgi:hypothetical protein
LVCVGNIAKAMGPAMEPFVRSLLDVMFSAGLSSTLVDALEQISVRYCTPFNYSFLSYNVVLKKCLRA